MMRKLKRMLAAAAGLTALAATTAQATEITVQDAQPTLRTWNGGGAGIAKEDNEVETNDAGTLAIITSQDWDLERFDLTASGASRTLTLTGGYNLITGNSGRTSGDLFISVFAPSASNPALNTPNSGGAQSGNPVNVVLNGSKGYSFAVDLSGLSGNSGTTAVYALDNQSTLLGVDYPSTRSNPWKVNTASTFTTTRWNWTLNAGTDASLGLKSNVGAGDDNMHHTMAVDLTWLNAAIWGLGLNPSTASVFFHYTMECGNDMIHGQTDGGFKAPDGGSTLAFLGLSLSAFSLIGRRSRKA